MTEQEIQNSIDNYLLHKMTIAEQEAFEKEMENDSDLMQKVEIQQLLVDEIRYKRDFERIVTKKPVIHITLKKTMVVVLGWCTLSCWCPWVSCFVCKKSTRT